MSHYPPSGTTDHNWFVETFTAGGCSFGLQINQLLHQETTPIQTISIYDTQTFGNLMVIDGCIMLTTRDNFLYHEMMTHPALLTHSQPKKVAIIGGGDCGSLYETLKHSSVESVIQIEIDERVTRLAERYFPELCQSNHDSRAQLLFQDGIDWIMQQPPASLDVIIIDSTDPVGPAEALFSDRFYTACYQALATGGVLVQQTESPLLHGTSIIGQAHADLKSAGFNSVRSLYFPQPVYPSGWWTATLATKHGDATQFRQSQPPHSTKYYSPAIHQSALACPPFMQQLIDQAVNRTDS